MAKIDLDSLGIEELASLCEHAPTSCSRKSLRAALEAELEKLTQYGKPPVKKAESAPAPAPKAKKSEKEPKESVAEAA